MRRWAANTILPDSAFYYTCVRSKLYIANSLTISYKLRIDFRLHVYDTKAPFKTQRAARLPRQEYDDGHTTTMEVIKTIQAAPGRWTITDSHLSPDNQR